MDLPIAIAELSSPQNHGGSPRMGSVWSRDGQRKSPDATSVLRKSLSSGAHTPNSEVNKRRAAADFIKQCTGLDLPYSNDLNFRQALRDGVILCETLNKVRPNAVQVETGSEAGLTNVQAFLSYISDHLQCPSEAKFSVHDLFSEDYDDRTRIVDCLLWLRKVYSCGDPVPSPFSFAMLRESSDIRAMRDSPRKGQNSVDLVTALSQQHQKQQQAQMGMVLPTGPRTLASTQANANLSALYSDMSQSLISRMTPGMPTPKYDTLLSNVMEQFLNGLSVEYERRLVAKDHELNASKEALRQFQKQVEGLQVQLDNIAGRLDAEKQQEMEMLAQEAQLRIRKLEDELAEARLVISEHAEALANAEEALGSRDGECSQREAALQAQLDETLLRLQDFEVLQQRFNAIREENKKLYNTIQDLKGSIRVFCRVRPLGTTGDPAPGCLNLGMEGELAVYDKAGERKVYRFDRVFGGQSTQEEVYEDVQALIRSVMDGYNVCIFAYGQTGSGKTHTMTGSNQAEEDVRSRGINYRALDDLFALQAQRDGETSYEITAQMLEIYNETIRDLLTEDQGGNNKLDILSTQPSGLNVPGATQIPVSNTADVLAMMRVGARNRHSAETKMNERSSRSHQVLTIIVDGVNMSTGARTHACLHLVDLAGSERTDKSGVEGERMREANSINTSLSALGTVMHSLASKSKHIPFRNSKLTELLADSLSGQAKVCMLMHIAPESTSYGETVSTLNFGNRVASVTLGQARCNVESGKVFEAHEALTKKDKVIAELKEQLLAAREREQVLQRQLQDETAQAHNFRNRLSMLGVGTVPQVNSSRAELCRTSSIPHPVDSAASTPISQIRPANRSNTTPRLSMGGLAQATELLPLSQTPRSQSFRSPAPLSFAGVPRAAAAGTPRASGAQVSTPPSEPPAPSSASARPGSDQQDKVGSLSAGRGNRGQHQPVASSTAVQPSAKNAVAASVRSLPPAIPSDRLDTAAVKSVPTSFSGSMSARPSSRHSVSGSSSSTGGAATAAASRRSNLPGGKANRPATSRAGSVYGSANSLPGLSFSSSIMLVDSPGSRAVSKPPLSSRPTGGWK
ncbi:hypothetical protein Vretimale_12657 [Volvox reticuliferus]|uniref:Kinesin-like protein n=1 Tax=Volvox reticuliferus TaxID=1737510 RepID=A0A8J4GJU8_9CHLO|nr:hypothetical protein Vretifemale_167 [Volvox reticuliferus]GIM08637.1 hypothetical protein Vretimale_12657 [Volvox reticuliferus]